jgi:AraC-like DNA-binding protein/catechol 2,3-dioxygenase-like lactoylglutathione lyase family enzyme
VRVTSRSDEEQHLRDLARLRRVRDRIDREYAQPLDVEALARGAHMSAGHLSRQFKLAYGESPYSYLMTRRIERAMALLRRGDLSVTDVCFAVGCSSLGHLRHSLHRTDRDAAQCLPEPDSSRDGGDAAMRGETGDQTDQESRSAGHRSAASVTAMDITIHASFLPHTDPDASLAFYRDTLGFEVRTDVGQGKMRWITVGPPGQPSTSILLAPPATDPGTTDDERRVITEMMAKGTYGWILLATKDLDGTFERLQAGHAEVVQEPTEQPYGIRDCAFRDPAGNLIRIQELR